MPQPFTLASLSLYAASVLCVLGLLGLMRPSKVTFRTGVTLVGLAGLAWLFVQAISLGGGPQGPPTSASYCVAFATIAVAGAVRMVTHPRPVFAALYFILVVLSSAGLFLLMQAEFMAFALVIVYAGAILITYMFVLMLAQQSPEDESNRLARDEYDRVPREPLWAALMGLVMLVALAQTLLAPGAATPTPPPGKDPAAARWAMLSRMPLLVLEAAQAEEPKATQVLKQADGTYLALDGGKHLARVALADGSQTVVNIADDSVLTNSRAVGMMLVSDFPASLELAGVILLMAMFGAVVLARKQLELGEDERREAAGLRRLTLDDPDSESTAAGWTGGDS